MTYAGQAALAGKRPITIVEMDLDLCALVHPGVAATHADTITDTTAAYNDQMMTQTEEFDGTDWTAQWGATATVTTAVSPPSGSDVVYAVEDTSAVLTSYIYETIAAATVSDGLQHVVFMKVKANTNDDLVVALRDTTAGAWRAYVRFAWVAGDLTVALAAAGTGSVSSLGDGWWRATVVTTVLTAANVHEYQFYPAITGGAGADVGITYATSAMLHVGTTPLEYQYEDARDGSSTNIRLTTGGLTYDAQIGKQCRINGTNYEIEDNGTNYVRVAGNATGEGLGTTVYINAFCDGASASGSECYNTRATCEDSANYDNSDTLELRFCEPRLSANEQVETAAIPSVRGSSLAPAVMEIGKGLGQRGKATITLQDHPHHDRGIDPYVSTRSYTPETQGTFWGKLRARNPYYQGRPLRVLVGYVTSPMDLTNNFQIHNYVLECIEGPDAKGTVRVIAKDPLKLADDERAQAPVASEGVLSVGITAVAGSATLSPAGIGNSDYPASGTVRIGSECMTFTRAADTLTLTQRGSDGTTAAAHDADETVQVCLRYTDAAVDDVIYDLLVTYAAVSSAYIDTSAWDTEVTDWLSGHSITALITEPTGVRDLLNEVCEQYMIALWWDDIDSEIDLKVLAPSTLTFDSLTQSTAIVEDTVSVADDSTSRLSQVWVYYDIRSPVEALDEAQNFRTVYVYPDTDAESADEYDDRRVKKFYSRWFTNEADAMRLAYRTLMRFRDNPRKISWELTAKDDYEPGDVVELTTPTLQGKDGASLATKVEITEARDVIPGHTRAYAGEDYAFKGRYFMITPDGAPDYGAASDEQKLIYGYICEDSAPYLGGDGEYKVV